MHRFSVSLWACLGALTVPHRGHSEARGPSSPARVESVAAKAESDAPPKLGSKGAVKTEGETGLKKASDPDAKPSAKTNDREKKPASATVKRVGTAKSPAWTRGQPGVVRLVRGSETLEVRVLDKKQHLVPATLPQFARFLRAKSGADHPIDARLVTLLAAVSDRFGGREMTVVSGFRPYSPGQHSRHSNHNEGRAIDFSIKGIANEAVRDFCRTFRNVGVGYYPNSLFVHLDVRDGNAYWVDYAAPGQAPRYRAPDGKDDDDDDADAIASVDGGPGGAMSSTDKPREDVARGRNVGRGGDRDVVGERGVFVNR